MNIRDLGRLLKDTFTAWNEDKAPRLGAALAYYTIFSIAPLLVIVIAVVGFFFGADATRGEISSQISRIVGAGAAEFIENMVASAGHSGNSALTILISTVTLALGAMGVFGQLQDALNTIWKVPDPEHQSIWELIRTRLTPFLMVVVIAFLLLASLCVSAAINFLGTWMHDVLPLPGWTLQIANTAVGFFIITLLFALIFKILPDASVEWHDVWIGAVVTSALFIIGQLGLSWYVGKAATSSTYGAAGSLVAVLVWVYWTAQILFFGAEFTRLFACRYGSQIIPETETQTPAPSGPLAVPVHFNLPDTNPQVSAEQKRLRELGADALAIASGFALVALVKRLVNRS